MCKCGYELRYVWQEEFTNCHSMWTSTYVLHMDSLNEIWRYHFYPMNPKVVSDYHSQANVIIGLACATIWCITFLGLALWLGKQVSQYTVDQNIHGVCRSVTYSTVHPKIYRMLSDQFNILIPPLIWPPSPTWVELLENPTNNCILTYQDQPQLKLWMISG